MIEPISPNDITVKKMETLPDAVMVVFNNIIAENWSGYKSYFKVKEVVARLCNALDCNDSFIYDKHYLDVESIYRERGWGVRYEQPCIGDSFEAFFEFTKR